MADRMSTCNHCYKRHFRLAGHGKCGTCGATCRVLRFADRAIRAQQPHYQFNDSSSAGFIGFLCRLLDVELQHPAITEVSDWIINAGRIRTREIDRCAGCRGDPPVCSQCVMSGRIDLDHIFIGLVQSDSLGRQKVRVTYICSAECLELAQVNGLRTNGDDLPASIVTNNEKNAALLQFKMLTV